MEMMTLLTTVEFSGPGSGAAFAAGLPAWFWLLFAAMVFTALFSFWKLLSYIRMALHIELEGLHLE